MIKLLTIYLIGVIGAWIFSDGLYSILLYLGKPGFNGVLQTWKRDHWIRVVRMILGLILIAIGAYINCVGF